MVIAIILSSFFSGYVQLYVDWVLNKSVYEMFKEFYHGFHSVCASNALLVSVNNYYAYSGLRSEGIAQSSPVGGCYKEKSK